MSFELRSVCNSTKLIIKSNITISETSTIGII